MQINILQNMSWCSDVSPASLEGLLGLKSFVDINVNKVTVWKIGLILSENRRFKYVGF